MKRKGYVPFLSSEKRLDAIKKGPTEIPGPGQYPVKGIKDDLNKKVWGKQGVFGSTERRFAQLSSMVLNIKISMKTKKTPGPGFYNAEEAVKEISQKAITEGPSSMFKIPMKISKKKPDIMPAIGEYDQSMNTIQSNLQKKKEKMQCKSLKILYYKQIHSGKI